MSSEKNELTFMRCPSCRSLVPTGSVKCRMCGFAFETPEGGDVASAARTSGRVRQRTVSKSREEILAALEQAELGGQTESSAAAPGYLGQEEDTAEATPSEDHGSGYEDDIESSEQVEVEPTYNNGHHEAHHTEASNTEANHSEGEDFQEEEAVILEEPAASHGLPNEPATEDYHASEDATDVWHDETPEEVPTEEMTAKSSHHHHDDNDDDVVSGGDVADEGRDVHVALGSAAETEEVSTPESEVSEQEPVAAQEEIIHMQEAETPVVQEEPTARTSNRPEAVIPARPQRESEPGFRLKSDNKDKKPANNQQGEKVAQDNSREDNRHQNGNPQQGGNKQQQGNRQQNQNQPQQAGGQEPSGGVRPESSRRERGDRGKPEGQDGRQQDNRQKDRDNNNRRTPEREQHGGTHGSQHPRHRNDESRGGAGRVEVKSTASADSLIGWLVSYEAPNGTGIELRGTKFFVTREQIRASDLVVADPSLSSPHCLVSAPGNGTLIVQDLLSERGITVKRIGSHTFENLDEVGTVANGDTVKFGSAEFLVVLIP